MSSNKQTTFYKQTASDGGCSFRRCHSHVQLQKLQGALARGMPAPCGNPAAAPCPAADDQRPEGGAG